MSALPRNVVIRWMSFAKEGDRIVALRRQTHKDTGTAGAAERTLQDVEGFHLGAFVGDELVAVLSAFVFENTDALQVYGLPKLFRALELVKFAELNSYRGTSLAEVLMVSMHRMVFEVLRPGSMFALCDGVGDSVSGRRWPDVGWKIKGRIKSRWGEGSILMIPAGNAMEVAYRRARKISEPLWLQLDNVPQSLVKHLDECGRMDLVARAALLSENMHIVAATSIKDELPRLSAQTRILFAEQKPRVAAVDFPKPPARLLDVGSGPGVYLSALGKTEKFQGYNLIGIDMSKEMVMYAKLNRSDIKWLHANAYDTKLEDASIDVVHLAFVMVHLMSPALALREFARILRPGGLLYIVDVNDATFEGGEAMRALIEAYDDLTMSDRKVMELLPRIAPEWNFEMRHRFATTARNTGTSAEPIFLPDEIRIDHIKMWGLLSGFIAQREELAAEVKVAHERYFASFEPCSIDLHTHVYQKLA